MPRPRTQTVTEVSHYRPIDSASGTGPDGVPWVIRPKDVFAADHWLVRTHPGLFRPVSTWRRPVVEAATQAPGELRGAQD